MTTIDQLTDKMDQLTAQIEEMLDEQKTPPLKYLKAEDIATQDDLYQALIRAVEPILAVEKSKREPLEAQYAEDIKPFADEYEDATADKQAHAIALLKPHKLAMDTELEVLKKRYNKLIDKTVKKYEREQKKVQAWYNSVTANAQAKFDEQVGPLKAELEEKTKALFDEAQEQIKPINEEYRLHAEALETKTLANSTGELND